MTEVDYSGGGHRTRLKDRRSIVCREVPPYIKEQGGGRRPRRRGTPRRSPTPTGSRTPPLSLLDYEREGKEVQEKKEGGRRPPLLVLFGLGGGARGPALAASPLLRKSPLRPINLPGGSGNLPVLR